MLFHCPRCNHELQVDEHPLPEQLSCDACGSTFPSEPDATMDYNAHTHGGDDFSHDEGVFQCPHCKNQLIVEQTPLPELLNCDVCGSAFPSEPDKTVEFDFGQSGVDFAHFELIDEVGSGSYGVVWKARDTRLDRIVALKIPRRDRLTPTEVDRFLVEAQTAAQLRHPGIVSIHDTGRFEHTVYIATDFVEGNTLNDWMDGRKLTHVEAAEICAKVADALHHAHECGIIHRDIKPSNIMVDSEDRPYITDFGLAKRESVDATIAVEGSLLGTPAYMSPEQARGEAHRADRRTDLYSLGVILFQMLTGERPFRGSRQMILQQVVEADPPHPRQLNSNIPDDLDTICFKCLEKTPARRYESASEVADELRRYLRGEPIKARPITRMKRSWRWCGRNPVTAGLLAALAVTLFTGFAVSTTQWVRAEYNAESAVAQAQLATAAAERESAAREITEQYLYVAHMNMAQQAYKLADPQRVRDILQRHVPVDGAVDRRSFEWFYWQRQAQRWSRSLQHAAALNAVAISPDGSIIATATSRNEITLWETVSGEEKKKLKGHDREVFAIAFVPGHPSTLVSASRDKTIRVWDVESGEETHLQHVDRATFSLAFSADGSSMVSCGADLKVRVWSFDPTQMDEPLVVRHELSGHFDFVYGVAISRDGSTVASASLDRTVRTWDAGSGEEMHTMEGHVLEVWSVAFAPDGKTLASGSADRTVRLWDVETGKAITALDRHTDRVRAVSYSPDGTMLVSASHDRTIRLWDMTATSEPLEVGYRNLNRPDDYFFERMQLPNSDFPKDEFKGHAGHVTALAWSGNGKTLVSGSVDRTARLWNVSELEQRALLGNHFKSVNAVTISTDGRSMLSGSNDRTARFWDLATMQQVGEGILHDEGVLAVALSPDGRTYATGGFDKKVRLGQLTGAEPTVIGNHDGGVASLAFSNDSKQLASASHDGTVRIWDVATGQLKLTYSSHTGRVQSVVYLPDGMVASAGGDRMIRVWNPANGEELLELAGNTGTVWSLTVSPDGTMLASGGWDRSIRIWNLTDSRMIQEIDAHAETIRGLAFCPDGLTLASSGDDKTIKLWDISTGEPKATFEGHKHKVWSLAFTPDSEKLLSASLLIRVWNAPRN